MLIHALQAPVFATNTLVLVPDEGGSAVVVDPGAGTAPLVAEVLAEHHVQVGAVVLTHGHPDHVWDGATVAGRAPVLVGRQDAERLADPVAHVGPLAPGFASMVAGAWQPVEHVQEVDAGRFEPVSGVVLHAIPAPGHTAGSTLWQVEGVTRLTGPAFGEAKVNGPLVLTGDVLFAGSVGRTDLPGGDEARMRETLRELATSLPREALLVPGHGPVTIMARELATNPFIARALG